MRRLREVVHDDARAASVVELRIHGVSGTPPEQMLDSDDIALVRGDEVAGFFRRREGGRAAPAAHAVEAYSWGGLTSRSWTRSLWVLLAPFAFVNVAGWMLPRQPGEGRRGRGVHRAAVVLVRLLALLTTVLVAVWVCQVAMDFVAFQCGGSAACREQASWVATVFDHEWLRDAPGRRLAIGALVPAALVLVLRRLGVESRARYERFATDSASGAGPTGTFADPAFWDSVEQIGRHARTHVAAAVAVVAALLASAVTDLPGASAQPARGVAVAALVVLLGSAVAASAPTGLDPSPPAVGAVVRWLRGPSVDIGLLVAAWVLGATAVATAFTSGAVDPTGLPPDERSLPVFSTAGPLLSLVALGITVLLVLALWRHPHRRAARDDLDGSHEVGFRGYGAAVAGLVGYGIAAILLLGLGSWIARWLGAPELVDHPAGYDAAAVLLVWVVLAVATPVTLWLTWRSSRRRLAAIAEDARAAFAPDTDVQVAGESDRDFTSLRRARWSRRVRTGRVLRVVVGRADTVLTVLVALTFLAMAPVAIPPLFGVDAGRAMLDRLSPWVVTSAVWVVAVGLPVAIVLVVRRSFSSTLARRKVGIVWDVATFWPRWFHPFAPPSYTARAVPELQTRIDVLTGDGAAVVLSAHSQGSVLALAALDGIRGRPLGGGRGGARGEHPLVTDRVALLTHGSPIGRLYQRYFPAQIAPAVDRVRSALRDDGDLGVRWLNLYRATDPIGGAIGVETGPLNPRTGTTAGPDCCAPIDLTNPLPDPDLRRPTDPFPPRGDPYPSLAGHSGYRRTPDYEAALAALGEAARTGAGARDGRHAVAGERSGS